MHAILSACGLVMFPLVISRPHSLKVCLPFLPPLAAVCLVAWLSGPVVQSINVLNTVVMDLLKQMQAI